MMGKILLFLWLVPFSIFAQSSGKTCETLMRINALIQREHYQPKPIDDSLSVFVFDTFIDELDGDRNLFTKAEYEKLCKHRLLIDDYFHSGDCSFLGEFAEMYQAALLRKKTILEKIRSIPLDYTSKDSIKFSRKKFSFDLSEGDFERVWRKRIRFEVLEDISKLGTNYDSLNRDFPKLEKISNVKIFDNNLCKTENILNSAKGIEADLQEHFLNIFCTYFDPHSNYFSPDGKASFLSMLSTSNLSLGVNVRVNEKEEIVIEEVVPGGPAAQSKQIEKGDVIVKVSNNKGIEYLVSCASLETIGDFIFSDSNPEIQLSIRKANGTLLDVNLQKQVLKATQNAVYSFVIGDDIKTGYIKIPNFYADFEGGTSQGCAADVFNEVLKLRRDNISGLVIDLLDNGGGSMDEAIKLAGLFVESGPVSVLVDSKGKQEIIKDQSRGSIFGGPMVLLINGNSASASELFAGAMQDYNRALIVGSTSLGKASMQTFLPVKTGKQESYIKLTIEKFYRVSGDSNQIKGIVPDVFMPVLFDSIIPRESSFKTALKYDKIITKAKYQKLNADHANIIKLSQERIQNDARLNEINALNKKINRLYSYPVPAVRLTFEDVFKLIRETENVWAKVKSIVDEPNGCTVAPTSYDTAQMESDLFLKDITEYRLKDVKNDPYAKEGAAIIKDYTLLKY